MEPKKSTNTSEVSSPPVYWEAPTPNLLKLKYIAIGAFILISGFAGGIYFSRHLSKAQISQYITTTPILSQTISPITQSDGMEGWKTYKNKEYGFEFKHPSDWFSNKDSYKRINFFKTNTTPLISEGGHLGNELLVVYWIESPLSLDEYGDKLIERIHIAEVFPQEIGDQSGFRYHDEYFSNNSYIVKTNNGFLTISFHEADYDSINQILSTFEFINK